MLSSMFGENREKPSKTGLHTRLQMKYTRQLEKDERSEITFSISSERLLETEGLKMKR